jgi:hypothetical protein
MKRLNWRIIFYNIVEAREQLQQIEARAKGRKKISEVELQIMLEHAYHHMNFAWNVRNAPTKRYTNLSDEDFDLWSKFPREIEVYKIGRRKKNKAKKAEGAMAKTKRSAVTKKRV